MALEVLGGLVLRSCRGGLEALAPESVAFAPDLLLLDVMMPEMDGPTTLEKLRSIPALAHTPAIFMTAKVQQHEVDQYLAMGVLGVISKPFNPVTLAAEVRALWDKRGPG